MRALTLLDANGPTGTFSNEDGPLRGDVVSSVLIKGIGGKALKGLRDNVVLATKAHIPMGDDPNQRGQFATLAALLPGAQVRVAREVGSHDTRQGERAPC